MTKINVGSERLLPVHSEMKYEVKPRKCNIEVLIQCLPLSTKVNCLHQSTDNFSQVEHEYCPNYIAGLFQ